jgi:hypothetical protein
MLRRSVALVIKGHQRSSRVINALVSRPLVDGPVEAFEGAKQPLALGIDEEQGRLGVGQQQLWGSRGRRAVVSSEDGSALGSHEDLIRISSVVASRGLGSH